jgi:hypothetical protein
VCVCVCVCAEGGGLLVVIVCVCVCVGAGEAEDNMSSDCARDLHIYTQTNISATNTHTQINMPDAGFQPKRSTRCTISIHFV